MLSKHLDFIETHIREPLLWPPVHLINHSYFLQIKKFVLILEDGGICDNEGPLYTKILRVSTELSHVTDLKSLKDARIFWSQFCLYFFSQGNEV